MEKTQENAKMDGKAEINSEEIIENMNFLMNRRINEKKFDKKSLEIKILQTIE